MANGIADPLDRQVVEVHWIGNSLLDNVRVAECGAFLDERFRRPARPGQPDLSAAPAGA